MKVNIKVIPRAKRNVVKRDGSILKIYVTAPATDGKANKAVCKKLAEHYNIKSNNISIIKGLKSTFKTINIVI